MPIIEQTVGSGQAASFIPAEEELAAEGCADPEPPQIGSLLRSLRGDRSLRQVEADTGVSNSYLCNLEGSLKKPGVKTLSKLASYYQISLQELLLAARLIENGPLLRLQGPARDVQRSYDFVMADPDFSQLTKLPEAPPMDYQRFIVEMYQHFTGKKLL
jgi:transcriptional regulator with XRE-family HTH domain